MGKKKILLIEPYYGGSHKRFLEGLTTHITLDFSLLSLPARKWKMRMQLASPWFIEQIKTMPMAARRFDIVLCSTFMDVAVFKAMAYSIDGWNPECHYFTFFHENQFCYPGYLKKHTNHQFTSINFTTALVSESNAFNSEYNRSAFLAEVEKYLLKATDVDLCGCLEHLKRKSLVLYPGLDFTSLDMARPAHPPKKPKTIIWNHRWEHDKNPEEFFETLYRLQDAGVPFRLCVLGQHFNKWPKCFDEGRKRLAAHIVHYGFVENRDDYYRLLKSGDIIVSTALHEFFGMSVLEAVRAGCTPVLPNRLSYPELFESHYLYDQGSLFVHLKKVLASDNRLTAQMISEMTDRYDWKNLASAYYRWLLQ